MENPAVSNFRGYLRIPSVHPNIDYEECVRFLKKQAEELRLPISVTYVAPRKPVVIITYEGTEPELPSLFLNSHMDVVPVFEENWTYHPFAAEKDENGNIYARGAQDCKCIGIQYIEAVRRFINEGLKFKRTIHISFVPDEELTFNSQGMIYFVKTDEFKKLNVGFSLDECAASPTDTFFLRYGERSIWGIEVTFEGTSGHGSVLYGNTAGEKLFKFMRRILEFREVEKQKLESNPELTQGDVTTVNLTMLSGGVQMNVVPPEFRAVFDVRVAVDVDLEELENQFEQWRLEAGEGVSIKYFAKSKKAGVTKLDATNKWWTTFKKECDQLKLKIKPVISPGGTDARFLRELGIPALGFSPMNNTKDLLYGHDEYLSEDVFLRGIDIYYNLIKSLASC